MADRSHSSSSSQIDPPLSAIIYPRLKAALVAVRGVSLQQRIRNIAFAMLGIVFWAGIYLFAHLLLKKVAAEEIYGAILLSKLLSFLFTIFFGVLVFSNVVTAITVLFLSDDLPILFSAPISSQRLFIARFIETAINSSWMVVFFGLPIFAAYGIVSHAGWAFYPWMLANLFAFAIMPSGLGVIVTLFLVKAFPARKTHDVLVIIAVLLVVGIYFLFRFLRPEQLFNPDVLHGVGEFFATLKTPDRYLAPAGWATQVMTLSLAGRNRDALLYLSLNLSNGLMVVVIGQWLSAILYPEAFSKAQEGKRARLVSKASMKKGRDRFATASGRIIEKDLRIFFRDTGQWTQLLLILALIVVYLYNFWALKLQHIAGLSFYVVNVISYFNILLVALIASAVSVRFVLPAVSLEGPSFWIIRSAPMRLRTFLWTKFALSFIPIAAMSELLVLFSARFLNASDFVKWISAATALLLTFGITGLAVGIGALYPNFRETNAARLATGASSILFMVLAMLFVTAVVLIEFYPALMIFRSSLSGIALKPLQWVYAFGSAVCDVTLVCIAAFLPMSLGRRALEKMEI